MAARSVAKVAGHGAAQNSAGILGVLVLADVLVGQTFMSVLNGPRRRAGRRGAPAAAHRSPPAMIPKPTLSHRRSTEPVAET
jgi:hypothetical protein